ncbi:MAG: HAMP domain-containing sensor histidine kinase [Xanthobacteraceae bacterium]
MDEKDVDEAVKPSIKSNAVTIGVTIACILGVVVGLTWIVTERAEYLPTLFISVTTQTVVAQGLDAFLWILSATALLVLFVHRRTILDLWLMAILVVWWPNFVLPIFSPVVRFTLGWYVGRGFALLASSTLLIVLLGESTALYARLANAIQLLRRERADRLMTIEAATSAIVHEVRQPLTAIAMQSRAALRWLGRVPPGPEIEEIRQCLNSTTDAVNRAEEILKSIRELFRQTPLRRTMLQLNDIVREVLKLTDHDLQVEGVSVTTEYDDNLPLINVDHTQIQQVILNLVKNAIDEMRGVPPSKRHMQVMTGFDGKLVAFYVQDTGPGIGVKDRERIFEPFFTTKSTGTGLGLSICRTIVETHGGLLRLAKTDPHGSSFEVAFPISSTSDTTLRAAAIGMN